jgi:phosphatidylglycerophosphatase A
MDTPPAGPDGQSPPLGVIAGLARILATGLGSGYSPIVPGTAGSAVGLLLFWPLSRLGTGWAAAATAVLFFVGVAASSHVARRAGSKDPSIVVVDEVLGMWATLLFLPLTPLLAAGGFVLFRVLDVLKPFPARQFESLPGGWGIMADDLMAGVYANLVLRVALLVLS